MRTVVISLGGSTLFESGCVDTAFVKDICRLLVTLKDKARIAVVVGGGRYARDYATAIRNASGNEFLADRAAIFATKANATVIQAGLGDAAFPRLIQVLDDAAIALNEGKIAVGCGILEGVSTDFDSMLLAERVQADAVINASNTDGVYSEDPKKNAKASKFKTLTHEQLETMASASDTRKAGTHFPFDVIASKLAARSKMEIHFVKGRNLNDLEKAILGKPHSGTLIKESS
ncbi:UMP kinase [Candidatus Micrarchaeota archaeon]|nr:UMP kinase [Candidatus Micrarchaeota archaeon]